MKSIFSWIAGLTFVLSAGLSQAAVIWETDGAGILTGARNVNVGGVLYNVEFVDGTCIDVFAGCDNEATDFVFTSSPAAAQAASEALRDQVFLDVAQGNFDSQPGLTRGCVGPACFIETPSSLEVPFFVFVSELFNDIFVDVVGGDLVIEFTDLTNNPSRTWARWSVVSQVPAPSTALCVILGAALAGAVFRLRKRERFLQDRT